MGFGMPQYPPTAAQGYSAPPSSQPIVSQPMSSGATGGPNGK